MNTNTLEIKDMLGEILLEGLGIGVLAIDTQLRVTHWNSWLEKNSSIKSSDIVGSSLIERFPEIKARNKAAYLTRCVEKSIPVILSSYLHQYLIPLDIFKDGKANRMLQNVKIYPLKKETNTHGAIIIIEDKTEAILHEAVIHRLNRLLKGIRLINQLIVNVDSRENLFQEACQILTEDIRFSCAWIGETRGNSLEVVPRFAHGIAIEHLEGVSFVCDETVMKDFRNHKRLMKTCKVIDDDCMPRNWTPWFQVATITESQSLCLMPVRRDGDRIIILVLYARQNNFFDEDVTLLLSEIAQDLSFGIDVLNERALRRNVQEALAKEKQYLEVTLQSIGDGMITTDGTGRIMMMNPVAEALTGWNMAEAKGQPLAKVFNIINEKTQKPCENTVEKVIATKGIVSLANHTLLISRDGRRIPILDSGAPIFTEDKQVSGVILVFQDDTERRTAQLIVEENEKKYRSLVEYSSDHIFMLSLEGRYVTSNDRVSPFDMAAGSTLIGKSLEDVYGSEVLTFYQRKLDEVITREKPVSFEHEMLTPEGVVYHHDTLYPVFRDNRLWAIGGICRDITAQKRAALEREEHHQERRRLQERLQQSQKMEAIGTLAGGIAHDFNNILSSVIGFTEISLDEVEKGSEIADNLQEVYRAGERAKNLVQQILAFSRKGSDAMQPVQMELIIKEALKLLRSSLPTTIEISTAIESHSLIIADPTQIHQIILNLCSNAAYAMEKSGGLLEITLTDTTLISEDDHAFQNLPSGDYIKLVVFDTGSGIAREHLNTIFEPYFTTKPTGEGTGLGLSIVHGIVKALGGDIAVDSEIGHGTTFTVLFPILKKRASESLQQAVSEKLPTGTERILVVDDEPAICKMTKRRLNNFGYSVETCNNSLEALSLFKKRNSDFDLLITDMTMPGMTGDKLAAEMLKIHPDLPVILCTGYSKKISEEIAQEIGIKAYADKPLNQDVLLKTVRQVLDEAKGSV